MALIQDTAASAALSRWLDGFVIELNLCPFARKERDDQRIQIYDSSAAGMETALEDLASGFQALDADRAIETSLLVFSDSSWLDFEAFLDLIAYGDNLLMALNYQGVFQLAHFHPDYCFHGVDHNDASHYTNRSPYPCLHLLREASLEGAIAKHPDTESIPDTNIALMQKMGVETLAAKLRDIAKN